jgi:hypothetical protein
MKLTGGEDPGEDNCLHAVPGKVDGRSIGEDVVSEFVALQGTDRTRGRSL